MIDLIFSFGKAKYYAKTHYTEDSIWKKWGYSYFQDEQIVSDQVVKGVWVYIVWIIWEQNYDLCDLKGNKIIWHVNYKGTNVYDLCDL